MVYSASVLGVDSPALVLGANTTGFATLSPAYIGSWSLTVAASDGCTVTTAAVNVTVGCGAPTQFNISGAQAAVYYAVWGGLGVGFLPALLDARRTLPGGPGRALTFSWGNVSAVSYDRSSSTPYAGPLRLVPPGARTVPQSAAQFLPAALVSSGAPQFVSPMNASSGSSVFFTPGAIGTYTLAASVTDGCTITSSNITVYAVCGATPAANASSNLPTTVIAGTPVSINLWSAANLYVSSLPASVAVRATSNGRLYSRYFANVSLSGTRTSLGSLGVTPRYTWTLLSHTPVPSPPALLSLAALRTQTPYAPPYSTASSVEAAVAGPLLSSNWSPAEATALTFGAGASSVAPTFSSTLLGRYTIGLVADDGCTSSSTTLTLDFRCSVPPGLTTNGGVTVSSLRDSAVTFPPAPLTGTLYHNAEFLVSVQWYIVPVSGVFLFEVPRYVSDRCAVFAGLLHAGGTIGFGFGKDASTCHPWRPGAGLRSACCIEHFELLRQLCWDASSRVRELRHRW